MNPLWWLLLDDRIRLSRLVAIPSGLLAVLFLLYGFIAPDSVWQGIALFVGLMAIALLVWKLGDWWQLRQLIRKAQEGMPERRRGFEVLPRK